MADNIKNQTLALENQLTKLNTAKTDEEYIKELEIYNKMLKEADFNNSSKTPSKKLVYEVDKVIAHKVYWLAKQVNKVNKKIIKYNKKRGNKCQKN